MKKTNESIWSKQSTRWSNVGSPTRPSLEDSAIMTKQARLCLNYIKEPKICVLGVTPEIIQLDWPNKAKLYVIAVVSNPARFERRYKLFNEFCERMKHEKQVELVTIELQQNSRPFVTNSKIKLRTDHELWFKENLINIAVRHLPKNWEYMAWVDSDLEFQNKDWVRETLEQLQTYKVVQLFSHCLDLGIKHEALQVHTGIFYAYCNGEIYNPPYFITNW